MNKIYLDKLCEFVLNTHKNYIEIDKNFNVDDCINNIKQNNSLNEKGLFLKYNFVELKSIISSIEYDQLILINPLSFNVYGHNEWFNFLNALLTILKDNYIHDNNINKKNILELADKTYKKKMIINDKLDDNVFNSVASSTNFILIIISQNNINIYNTDLSDTKLNKVVVMFKHSNEYFPIVNWNQKYFNKNNEFIEYLFELYKKQNTNVFIEQYDNTNNFTKVEYKKKNKLNKNNITDIENKNNITDIENNDNILTTVNYENNLNKQDEDEIDTNQQDKYEELMTNEDYALYISEAICDDNTNKKKNINLSDTKKKTKKSKNIFVINHDESNNITNNMKKEDVLEEKDSSVFNITEKISKKDIDEITNNLKATQSLEQIQSYSLKLGINIFNGSTKTGKPKNKTKNDLITELKNIIINYN